jgi:WD40 repeat protein
MKNGKKEIELQNGSPVQALTVHPKRNNILVSGGNDGSIRFFDLSKKALYEANDHFGTKEVKRVYSRVVLKGILSLGFISDSKLVVVYPSNTFAVLKISFNNDGTISREREKKEFPLCVPGGEVSSVMRAAFNYKDPLKVIFRCFPVGRVFCRNVRELILRKKSDIINADGSKGEVLPGPLFSYNPSKKDEVVFCGCSIDGTRMRFDVCQVTDEEETRHDKDSKCNYKTYITKLEQLSIGCNEVVNIQKEAEPCSIQVLPSHLITEVTQLMKVRSRSLK